MTLRNSAKNEPNKAVKTPQRGKDDKPVVGIAAVADFLGFSQRTVCNWKQEFDDFPVTQDKVSCVWESSERQLTAWKASHPDLFTLHKERRASTGRREDDGRRPSRW